MACQLKSAEFLSQLGQLQNNEVNIPGKGLRPRFSQLSPAIWCKKKKLNCAFWGKSIKLGTVIALAVPIVSSYGQQLKYARVRHIVPLRGGVIAVLFWSGKCILFKEP